jgi:hypothetical protein
MQANEKELYDYEGCDRKELHWKELHNWYVLSNIVGMIKSIRMNLAYRYLEA